LKIEVHGYFVHTIARAWSDNGSVMWSCLVALTWPQKLGKQG